MVNQAGLLIAYDVVPTTSVAHDAVGNFLSFQSWAGESHCVIHDPDGQLFGWHLMERRKENLPRALGDQLSTVHVLLRDVDGYTSRKCFLPLSSQQVNTILKSGVDSLDELDTVVGTFLPKPMEEDFSKRSNTGLGRLLLLRASDEVLHEDREKSISSATIKNLLDTLNQQHTAAIPCKLFDIILFPSPWPGLEDQWTILWLSTTVLTPNSEEIHIPKTLLDLIEYAKATKIINNLSLRLQELPLGQRTPSEYVRDIVVNRRQLLDKYSGRHLEDRDKTIQELLDTGRIYSKLKRELEHNYVKFEIIRKGGGHYLDAIAHPRRFLILDRLEEALEGSKQAYSAVRDGLETREAAVKEFLRDYLTAEVAESNLAIQRKMQWLTVVAVVAAILALAASILSDGDKKAIRHLLGLPDN